MLQGPLRLAPRQVYPGQRLSVPTIEPGAVRSIRREAEALLTR